MCRWHLVCVCVCGKWRDASCRVEMRKREIIIRLSKFLILIFFSFRFSRCQFTFVPSWFERTNERTHQSFRVVRRMCAGTAQRPPHMDRSADTYTISARTNSKIDNLRFRSASSGANASIGRSDHLSNAAGYYSTMADSGDKRAIIRWPFSVHAMAAVHLMETKNENDGYRDDGTKWRNVLAFLMGHSAQLTAAASAR